MLAVELRCRGRRFVSHPFAQDIFAHFVSEHLHAWVWVAVSEQLVFMVYLMVALLILTGFEEVLEVLALACQIRSTCAKLCEKTHFELMIRSSSS